MTFHISTNCPSSQNVAQFILTKRKLTSVTHIRLWHSSHATNWCDLAQIASFLIKHTLFQRFFKQYNLGYSCSRIPLHIYCIAANISSVKSSYYRINNIFCFNTYRHFVYSPLFEGLKCTLSLTYPRDTSQILKNNPIGSTPFCIRWLCAEIRNV